MNIRAFIVDIWNKYTVWQGMMHTFKLTCTFLSTAVAISEIRHDLRVAQGLIPRAPAARSGIVVHGWAAGHVTSLPHIGTLALHHVFTISGMSPAFMLAEIKVSTLHVARAQRNVERLQRSIEEERSEGASPPKTYIGIGRPADRAALARANSAVVAVPFAAVACRARCFLHAPSEDLHFGHAERSPAAACHHVDESPCQWLRASNIPGPRGGHVYNAGLIVRGVYRISNVDRQKLVASRTLDQAVQVSGMDADTRDAAQGDQVSAPGRNVDHIGQEAVNSVGLC